YKSFDDKQQAGKAAGVMAVVGVINLPIIHYSVEWWNTLHQPASVLRMDGPTIHSSMLWALLVMAIGFTAFYVSLLLIRIRSELAARRIEALQRLAAAGSS
ncbi:MAG: heme transporter HemC, partial [Alphaproteobacteria bacterium]|nr:heme transporter HemC [Alphaproteobacteria bacterium]